MTNFQTSPTPKSVAVQEAMQTLTHIADRGETLTTDHVANFIDTLRQDGHTPRMQAERIVEILQHGSIALDIYKFEVVVNAAVEAGLGVLMRDFSLAPSPLGESTLPPESANQKNAHEKTVAPIPSVGEILDNSKLTQSERVFLYPILAKIEAGDLLTGLGGFTGNTLGKFALGIKDLRDNLEERFSSWERMGDLLESYISIAKIDAAHIEPAKSSIGEALYRAPDGYAAAVVELTKKTQ